MSGRVAAKGWCPGAYRPMRSGDGLIVRMRPRLARLDAGQALGLCRLAIRFGAGLIDLTSRANLQVRGVREEAHEALLQELAALDLLDADPVAEARRNILVAPFWEAGDQTARLAQALEDRLNELPVLPAKFGFAVDTGPERLLAECSADIRIERGVVGGLVVRADGAAPGRAATEASVIDDVLALARWFAARAPQEIRRMAALIARAGPPEGWASATPVAASPKPEPGPTPLGPLLGAPFGRIEAQALAEAIERSGATALRVTPWRLFLLEGADPARLGEGVVAAPGDPLLAVDACPGAPFCASAETETRALAAALAGRVPGSLHVSGCAKGCARSAPAAITLVGRNGRFDLVRNGRAWDGPDERGLSPAQLRARFQ